MKKILSIALLLLPLMFASAAEKMTEQKVKVQVTENGFEPAEIKVKAGSHVVLLVTRTTDATCATTIQIKEKKIKRDLPLNQEVSLDLGTVKKGEVRFACGMDIISGRVIVE